LYLGSAGFESRPGKSKVKVDFFARHDGIWGTGGIASCSGRITPSEKFPGAYSIGG